MYTIYHTNLKDDDLKCYRVNIHKNKNACLWNWCGNEDTHQNLQSSIHELLPTSIPDTVFVVTIIAQLRQSP